MENRPWLEELRSQLAYHNLPPLYSERLLSELSDHIHDFTEDRMSTDARDLHGMFNALGSPGEIAAAAKAELRKLRFSARHPLLMFALLPIVILPLSWAAMGFGFALFGQAAEWLLGEGVTSRPSVMLESLMPLVAVGILMVPVTLVTIWFCRLAGKAAVGWQWRWLACGLIALQAFFIFTDIIPPGPGARGLLHRSMITHSSPPIEPEKHKLMLGLGVRSRPSNWQLFQLALPLAICGCAGWRQIQARKQMNEAAT